MFLHLAGASVSQLGITVGQRQAAGQAGHRQAEDPSTFFCGVGQGTTSGPQGLSAGRDLVSGERGWGGSGPTEAEQEDFHPGEQKRAQRGGRQPAWHP